MENDSGNEMAIQSLLSQVETLKFELQILKARNQKVELDKAWETSNFRRVSIILCTYFVTALVFWIIKAESALLAALIPTIGYLVSTLSLPLLKSWWVELFWS